MGLKKNILWGMSLAYASPKLADLYIVTVFFGTCAVLGIICLYGAHAEKKFDKYWAEQERIRQEEYHAKTNSFEYRMRLEERARKEQEEYAFWCKFWMKYPPHERPDKYKDLPYIPRK